MSAGQNNAPLNVRQILSESASWSEANESVSEQLPSRCEALADHTLGPSRAIHAYILNPGKRNPRADDRRVQRVAERTDGQASDYLQGSQYAAHRELAVSL